MIFFAFVSSIALIIFHAKSPSGEGRGQFSWIFLVCILLLGIFFYTSYIVYQKQKNEKSLINATKRYIDLINNIQAGVITCLFDPKTNSSKTIYINEGWTELTGYTLEELNQELGGNPQALVWGEDKEMARRTYATQTQSSDQYRLQYRIQRKDGKVIWVIDRGVISVDTNHNIQNQSIISEVTEFKESEKRLLELSQLDPLTRLYNKLATASMAESILRTNPEGLHAVMVLDIDNFKGVNNSLGHIFGDAVLIEVSARLKRLFRKSDITGRVGGDEFFVLMSNVPSRGVVEKKAAEICETFRNTYSGEHQNYKISCSLGIAFSCDGSEYQDLFRKADIALYEAKIKGKDQFVLYDGEKHKQMGIYGEEERKNTPRERDSGALELKERIFELLYDSIDFSGSANMVLALLGRLIGASRFYVFENSTDNRISNMIYEWCAEDVQPGIPHIQEIDLENSRYLSLFDDRGVFYCNDSHQLAKESRKNWGSFEIKSVLQIAIKQNGKICGFLGCDNYKSEEVNLHDHIDLMFFTSKVMGTFLLKRRAEAKTELYNQNKMEALDHLPNSIYVVNEEFQIQYMNNIAKHLVPAAKTGDFCYQAFMMNKVPCKDCPIKQCEDGPASAEIYNEKLDFWFISSASKIVWSGRKNMRLISCQDITKSKKATYHKNDW